MSKFIIINPNDETFGDLMRDITRAIRNADEKTIDKIKAKFAEADIDLFYNANRDEIRVLRKNCPFVDFPLSQFDGPVVSTSPKVEAKNATKTK